MPAWVVVSLWWSSKAKPWLVKNWMWVVFPVGILLLLLGWSRKPKELVVVDTQLHGADKVKDKVSAELEDKLEELKEDRDDELVEAVSDHKESIDEQVDDMKDDAEKLVKNPDKLNKHLLEVGKRARGG